MVEFEKSDIVQFPGFETLGDISASAAETQKIWQRLSVGFVAAGLMVAAMLPMSLLQEVKNLSPGPIEDQMIKGLEWWSFQMTTKHIDLPATRARQFVDDMSAAEWQTVYCVVQSSGLPGEYVRWVSDLFSNGTYVHDCD